MEVTFIEKIVIFVIAVIVVSVIVCSSKTERGRLFLNNTGTEVCSGTLKTTTWYTTEYEFTCDDGRVLKNLTNFRVLVRPDENVRNK